MNTYGEKAFWLNEIIAHMNNEEAYYSSGWLYIWPDGTNSNDVDDYFGTPEAYEELENLFKKVYRRYHRDGLYSSKGIGEDLLKRAHEWDDKLELVHIVDVGKEKMPLAQDAKERLIVETLKNNETTADIVVEIQDEADRDFPDEPYKCLYFESNEDARAAYKVLKASKNWVTVKLYDDYWGPDGYSTLEVIISDYANDETDEKEVN